jgi:hypothetical protein
MTNEKARDFFSAYYEDSLEAGLRVSFEQKLSTDHSLKDEYRAFQDAMESLDTMKFEDISIPDDLHERISARLDRAIYDQKKAKPALTLWLRSLSYSAVAAVAIVGAIFTINARSNNSNVADFVPATTKASINYSVTGSDVTLKYAPRSHEVVVVTDAAGKEVSRTDVGIESNREMKTVLSNPLATPAIFGVKIEGEESSTIVAIPGKERSAINKGDGTIADLAKAIADFYHTHVTVTTNAPTEQLNWTFSSADVVSETGRVLGRNYSVTLLADGRLEIVRNK